MSALWGRAPSWGAAEAALEGALAAGAEEAQAEHRGRSIFEVNFEGGALTLVRSYVQGEVEIAALRGGRRGVILEGEGAADALAAAGARALAVSASSPEAPEVGLAKGSEEAHFDWGPTEPDREAIVGEVAEHLRALEGEVPGGRIAGGGSYAFVEERRALVTSGGRRLSARRGYHLFKGNYAGKGPRGTTSMNYLTASAYAPFGCLLDAPGHRRILAHTCASFEPIGVGETFVGDIIFTPEAVGTLTSILGRALSGYSVLAGTSPFADAIGEAIASPLFTLTNRPDHPEMPEGSDFDRDGVLTGSVPVIEGGALRTFLVDHQAGQRLEHAVTGGAQNVSIAPGERALDDLIGRTRRGLLLGRFSGGQPNQNLDFSGIAKNAFLIEDGVLSRPLRETMIAGNLKALLKDIWGVSREVVNSGRASAPFIAAGGVSISSH